jgi:hypothetical protein
MSRDRVEALYNKEDSFTGRPPDAGEYRLAALDTLRHGDIATAQVLATLAVERELDTLVNYGLKVVQT